MLPAHFISRIKTQLGDEAEAFLAALETPSPVSIRFNPLKPTSPLADYENIPWCGLGRYLVERPSFTLDPSFHAGSYYVQEASSMFISEIINQQTSLDEDYTVLDLCAAPGGKTTLLAGQLSPNSLIVANEIVPKRAGQLMENVIKWGAANVLVTQNDPKDFSRLNEVFDIMVIDAPCSGEGMFRKDPNAITEWTEHAAAFCSNRQVEILESILPSLKPGGLLIYSTCTFAPEENENIVKYLNEKQNFNPVQIIINPDWGIVESNPAGFHFYPHKIKGEGFFVCCLRKSGEMEETNYQRRYREKPLPADSYKDWFSPLEGSKFILFNELSGIIARNERAASIFDQFNRQLRFKRSGLLLGKLAGKDFIPDHELALSGLVSSQVPRIEVDKSMALNFLKKENFDLTDVLKGWCLITYEGLALGWVKSLGNRVNNYYPSDWRIRMRLD